MHSLLSMNENNQLHIIIFHPIPMVLIMFFFKIKTSHLSSLNGLKSIIDLFNGMVNPKCIVDSPTLYITFHVYAIF